MMRTSLKIGLMLGCLIGVAGCGGSEPPATIKRDPNDAPIQRIQAGAPGGAAAPASTDAATVE